MKNIILSILILFSLSYASESNPTKEEVARIYVATFNRAPDSGGLNYWMNESFGGHPTLSQIAQSFFDQSETQALYPPSTTNRDFIESVYQNLFNREPDTLGWNYWEDKLNATNVYGYNPELSKIPKNSFILATINGAQDTSVSNDKTILVNKTAVGIKFVEENLDDKTLAKAVMQDVNDSEDSVNMAERDIQSATYKVVSKFDGIGNIRTIAQKGDTLFVGSYEGVLYIINVADKQNPTMVAQLDTSDVVEDIAIDTTDANLANKLFIANNQKGLTVVDISDLTAPKIITSIQAGYGRAVRVKNSQVYLAAGYAGIVIFDANTYEKLSTIPVAGDFTDSISIPQDNYALTSDDYSKDITISYILEKKQAGTIEKKMSLLNNKRDMKIVSSHLYVADATAGLLIYDVSDILNAKLLSDTPPSHDLSLAVEVSSDETKAFVAANTSGVDIYDITDKSNPKIVATVDTPESAQMTQLSSDEDYLYVADGKQGLKIIKLSPTTTTTTTTISEFMDITKWDIYGTADITDSLFTIGDDIGKDTNDVDKDGNLYNKYADGSTQYDYDVAVSKPTFTPPVTISFSGTLSTTNFGYNEIGFAYKNENFPATAGGGAPITTQLATFGFRWEDGDTLHTYVDKEGYDNAVIDASNIQASNAKLSGDYKIVWDGTTVGFYYNGSAVATLPLVYKSGEKVVAYIKTYEHSFQLSSIDINSTASTTTSTTTTTQPDGTTTIGATTWVDAEPDGVFDYNTSKKYCEDLGYRLPTGDELVAVWNYYGQTPSPTGFKKDTFYWAEGGGSCAMDYDCSSVESMPLNGNGHPKCVVK